MTALILILCTLLGTLLPSIQVPAPDGWRRRAIKERLMRRR